jgi:hypothetical protein
MLVHFIVTSLLVSYGRSFAFIPSKNEHRTAPNPCGAPFQVAALDTKAARLKAGPSPSPL